MKKILLLGGNESIGKYTIDVIGEHKDELELVGISVGENTDLLIQLLKLYKLEFVYSIEKNESLFEEYPNTKFYYGEKGLEEIVKEKNYDLLVNGLTGITGFKLTINAINNNKDIALAGLDSFMIGGELICALAKEKGVKLFPLDNKLSSIYKYLQKHDRNDIRRIIIPCLKKYREQETNIDDLKTKNNVNSLTMINGAFEIISAQYLFDISIDNIEIIITNHDCIIPSLIEFNDGTINVSMSNLDAYSSIKYALLYPNINDDELTSYIDFSKSLNLSFEPIDYLYYPLVKLTKSIGSFGGNFGSILNGANDEAVDLFLNGRIKFNEIEDYIFKTLKKAHYIKNPSIEELLDDNRWAKEFVRNTWANNK